MNPGFSGDLFLASPLSLWKELCLFYPEPFVDKNKCLVSPGFGKSLRAKAKLSVLLRLASCFKFRFFGLRECLAFWTAYQQI